jgi:hypothetical protein
MLELEKILDLLRPFCFIKDIESIYAGFSNCQTEDDAILLRNKLKKIRSESYYPVLNQSLIEDAIYQSLIYLAEHFPINETDPISLDECHEQSSVVVSSGHRFNFDSLALYLQGQSYHLMKNPFTNQRLDYQDALRIICELDLRYPKAFNSPNLQYNKELFLWNFKMQRLAKTFLNDSHDNQIKLSERLLSMSLILNSFFHILTMDLIVHNYYRIFKVVDNPDISSIEANLLLVSNLISLFLCQSIFQKTVNTSECLAAKLRLNIFKTLLNCATLIGIDLTLNIFNFLMASLLSESNKKIIAASHVFMRFYGFYFLCLTLKYPRRQINLEVLMGLMFNEASLFTISNLIKTIMFAGLRTFQSVSAGEDLAINDYSFYFPTACFIYLLISESKDFFAQKIQRIINEEQRIAMHENNFGLN